METCDISHAVATQLKAHWGDHAPWQAFPQQAGSTLSRFQQTAPAFPPPPRQRTKARYMAVDAHVQWTQTIAVSKIVQTVLKTRGLSQATPARARAELSALEPLAAPVADFRTRLLEHVEQEAAKLPAGATWLASSDIIESVFGHYKTFTARGPLKEVGRLVLPIPAFLSDLSAAAIREAMTSVRGIDVEQWVENNIGLSMLARRRHAFGPDIKTA